MSDVKTRKKSPLKISKARLRIDFWLMLVLGTIFTGLMILLAGRLNITGEIPLNKILHVSDRTRNILADTQGVIKISCFMDRRHPVFRPLSRLLRGFRSASRRVAGADLQIEYVDPRWDIARAGQFSSMKVPENSLLFQKNRRRIIVTLDDMLTPRSALRVQERPPDERERMPWERKTTAPLGHFRGERVCAAAIARLALPYDRAVIYWMTGHGEVRYDDYDPLYGFSDIAREIHRDGFDLKPLRLPGLVSIPRDCQVLVIAGARTLFVPEEIAMLDEYLKRGGRLLCLLTPGTSVGLEKFLAKWGVRVTTYVAASTRTLTGNEVFFNTFADHIVTRNLSNSSVVFGHALCLESLQNLSSGSDGTKVWMLVCTDEKGWGEADPGHLPRTYDRNRDLKGPVSVAAAVESGGNVAKDVAFSPTRLCIFGESAFVMNGSLDSRAHANRDLLLNAVSWLAGIDSETASSVGGDATLITGFTRRDWIWMVLAGSVIFPSLFFLLSFLLFRFGKRW